MKQAFTTIGKRINEYDLLDIQDVGAFNNLFPECPIKDYCPLTELIILDPAPNNSRYMYLDGLLITHKMYPNLLYNVDKDEYYADEDKELDYIMGHPV